MESLGRKKCECLGHSLTVQWLRLQAFTAKGSGSVPGWGTKIPQDKRGGQKKMPPSTLGHNIKVLSICLDFLEFLRRLLPLPVFLSCASSIKRFKSDSWPNTRVASQLNPPRGKKGRKKALVLNTDNKKSISADTRPHPHPDTETG